MKTKKIVKQFIYMGIIKTLWFNFRYLPFSEARHLPILLARDVQVRKCHRYFCTFLGGVRFGMFRIGFCDRQISYNRGSSLNINGKIIIEGKGIHSFGPGTRLMIGAKGTLQLGNNFSASVGNTIMCAHSIIVGADNMWSFDNVIMDNDSHQIHSSDGAVLNKNAPIKFGNHVWLGCRNIILKNTIVPNGCVVASGSKLSKEYDKPDCIITSNGKIIRENIKWKRDQSI